MVYIYIYIYILAAFTRCCPANDNIKHHRSLSNFTLVGTLIIFWQPKLLSQGVANIKPHTLPHSHVVCNAHPVTWTPYAKFQPYKSIYEFLVGIMTSYGCGNDQTTPIDNTHLFVMLSQLLGNLIPNFILYGRLKSF